METVAGQEAPSPRFGAGGPGDPLPRGPFAGSPRRPVCCAIGSLRDFPPDHLLRLHELGVDFLQLRDREVPEGECEAFLARLAREAPGVLRRVLVNDRLALAAVFPVAGVHLPEAGIPVAAARTRFPRGRFLIGRSVHDLEAALAAEHDGADYVVLGPAAPTPGKRPLLPTVLPAVCARLRIPVWAVGGMAPESLARAQDAGASGFAAIRAFCDLERATRFVAAARTPHSGGVNPVGHLH